MGHPDRRQVLKAAATAAAAPPFAAATTAVGATATPAITKGMTRLRIAMPWPDSPCGLADDAHRFCRTIERLTDKRISFTHAATTTDHIEQLTTGAIDAAFGFEHAKVSLHPGFAYYAGLPGRLGVEAETLVRWAQSDAARVQWDRLSAEFGFATFVAGHTSVAARLWSTTPITSLKELTGRHIVIDGLAADVVRGLGGIAISHAADAYLPPYSGIPENGTSVLTCCATMSQAMAQQLQVAAKFVTPSRFVANGSMLTLTVNRTALAAGAAHLLASATAAAFRMNFGGTANQRSNDSALFGLLLEANALSSYEQGADFTSAIDRVSEAVLADIAARDTYAKTINHSYVTMLNAPFSA